MEKTGAIVRDPDIFEKKILRLFVPNALSSSGVVFINLLGPVIAGQVIGESALAAIALMAPILMIDEGLHDLLGSGIGRLVSRLKVQSGSETANRFLGAVIFFVFLIYFGAAAALLCLRRPIIGLFTTDAALIDVVLSYYVPTVAAMPFLELLLCLQKAYSADGDAALFSLKGPITAASGLFLNVLFVAVLKLGLAGVAYAAILSTLLGYSVLLIHRLSGSAGIRPDFSVLKDRKECFCFLKMELSIGKEYAPWDLYGIFSSGIVNKLFLLAGGPQALAIWSVTDSVMGIAAGISVQFNSCFDLVTNLLLGGEDIAACKRVVKRSARALLLMGVLLGGVFFLLAGPLVGLFGAYSYYGACRSALRIAACSVPFLLYSRMMRELFLSLGKNGSYRIVCACENVLVIPVMWLLVPLGASGAILGYYGTFLIAAGAAFLLSRRKDVFPAEKNTGALTSFFFPLTPENNAEAARLVWEFLTDAKYGRAQSYLTSLLVEECCRFVWAERKTKTKPLSMYIRLKVSDGKLRLIFCDDGPAFNLMKTVQEQHKDMDSPEAKIITACSRNMQYERILEMNYLQLSPCREETS